MKRTIRTWRVQPIKDGMKAPYSFVNTTEEKMWKAEQAAKTLAKQSCRLSQLGWDVCVNLVL